MRVTDPNGATWEIRRRLFRRPDWSRFRKPDVAADVLSATPDFAGEGLAGGGVAGLLIGVALVLVIGLLIVVVWPLILLLAELVLALVIVGIRLALGRWTVVAEGPDLARAWEVRGGGRAKVLMGEVAAAIESGGELPPGFSSF